MMKINELIDALLFNERDRFLYELLAISFQLPKNESTVRLWQLIDSWVYTIANRENEEFYKKVIAMRNKLIGDPAQGVEWRELLLKDTYVYCSDCKFGDKLFESIMEKTDKPEQCKECYPYDPEDSKRYEVRKNYEAKYSGCVNCKFGNDLLEAIADETDIPDPCRICEFYGLGTNFVEK